MSLTKLIQAVERGEWPGEINGIARAVFPYNEDWRKDHGVMAHEAFDGSLDAAKRLHDALLPERYGIALQYCQRYAAKAIICDPMDGQNWQSGDEWIDPARAWLLAILRALEEKGR